MRLNLVSVHKSAGRRLRQIAQGAALVVPMLGIFSADALATITVFEAAGANPLAITPTRDAFRTAVGGGTSAAANGNFGDVRREINWDGIPDAFSAPTLMPGNFFNVNSPRGALFTTPGTGFLASAKAASGTPILFGFPGDLQTFSAERLFAIVGSNTMEINFRVPGTNTVATTSAFGAIFVDLEDNSVNAFTKMEFFDAGNALIFSRNGLAAGNQGLTFLGGVANDGERIARVVITTPDNFLLSNGVRANEINDFVVMDDFLYATPSAVPEPEVWVMALAGLALVGWRSRKRTRRA